MAEFDNTIQQDTSIADVYPDSVSVDVVNGLGSLPAIRGKHFVKIGILSPDGNPGQWVSKIATVQVDSGSCGILIPAELLFQSGYQYDQNNPSTPPTGTLLPGVELASSNLVPVEYFPSTDDMAGFHYQVSCLGVGVSDTDEAQVLLQDITVLGIVNKSPFMMGVGFSQPLLADNPFLQNAANPAGQLLYPSYYIDGDSIIIGAIPPDNVQYQILTRQPHQANPLELPQFNWSAMQGILTMKSSDGTSVFSESVEVLLDTGLDLMMAVDINGLPAPDATPNAVGNSLEVNVTGTSLTYQFQLTNTGKAQLNATHGAPATTIYTTVNSVKDPGNQLVLLGDSPKSSGSAPTVVDVISHPHLHPHPHPNPKPKQPFLNIGFNPLFQLGMLFDKMNNRVGFLQLQAPERRN